MAQSDKEPISCAGGCKRQSLDPAGSGWLFLPITGRYRCGQCTRDLEAVNKQSKEAERG